MMLVIIFEQMFLFYYVLAGFAGVTRQRPSVSNVGIEGVGSAGQAGFTYQAFV